ncbi:membrane protein [Streptomyces phage OnionKnight]|nr:membrane protein [Streptomyces phage OnionKnight]
MIQLLAFVLLVIVATGLPLAHWAYLPWRKR